MPPAAPPSRRRSRSIRAAALVTLGLGAAGCDEAPPPDLPGQAEARLDACRAAHQRLGEDPAGCDLLEQVIAAEHAQARPRFASLAACQANFGVGACEGEAAPVPRPGWRPGLAGWSRVPGAASQVVTPAIRAQDGQVWALSEPMRPAATGLARLPPPRPVPEPDHPPTVRVNAMLQRAVLRLMPLYADQAGCAATWAGCEPARPALANRFSTREACAAIWSDCLEVEVGDAPAGSEMEGAATPAGDTGPTTGTRRSHPYIWWGAYNSYWRRGHLGGIGPRYQGWTWTADRRPTAAYRPATGTGPLRAWDGGANRLGVAGRMTTSAGRAGQGVSRPATTITRAGFGSTGRAYSSGG